MIFVPFEGLFNHRQFHSETCFEIMLEDNLVGYNPIVSYWLADGLRGSLYDCNFKTNILFPKIGVSKDFSFSQ